MQRYYLIFLLIWSSKNCYRTQQYFLQNYCDSWVQDMIFLGNYKN